MNLTAPLTMVLQFFLKRRGEERERVADYLDSIAADAKEIAEVWRDILKEYNEGTKKPSNDEGIGNAINELRRHSGGQAYLYHKLDAFYEDISQVIGRRSEGELQENIMFRLGSLLKFRKLAKQDVEAVLSNASKQVFLDEKNTESDIRDIQGAVLAIQREAASLEVLAKTYRASIRTSI